MDENQFKAHILFALRTFQSSLRIYQQEFKKTPDFIIGGVAPEIPAELLTSCKVFTKREDIIATIPLNGIGVEVGTQTGRFARRIVDLAQPQKLYLLDITYKSFCRDLLSDELNSGKIVTKEGLSWELLEEFEDDYFDFIYIDGAHDYDSVNKDLAVSLRKAKPGGLIICNDFTVWSALEGTPYGVYKAATQYIVENRLQVTHFALHPYGYSDIAFKKP